MAEMFACSLNVSHEESTGKCVGELTDARARDEMAFECEMLVGRQRVEEEVSGLQKDDSRHRDEVGKPSRFGRVSVQLRMRHGSHKFKSELNKV